MMDMNCPVMGMEGMGWMMGGLAVVWLLTLVFLVLGIAAFTKYLFGGRSKAKREGEAL